MNILENKGLCKKLQTAAIWVIVAGFLGLYISLLFNHNIWTDEAFTLQLIKGNAGEIIEGTAEDVHPPLYYLYAKLFAVIFGDALIVQKAAAIVPMLATLVLGATLIRKNFGDKAAVLFLLFLTCIPCTMEFAVQVRMYSLALFLVTVCGVYAYLAFRDGKKKDFLVAALSGLMAAYTHYFAFVCVIVIMGLLLLAIVIWNRKRLAAWEVSAALMIICYLPWFPYFIRQIQNVEQGYWISEITETVVWGYFTWAFDLSLVPGVVFIFLIILKSASTYNIIEIALKREQTQIYALLCMLTPALTALLGVAVSCLGTPIYRDQYIFPALGMLALFFAIAMRGAKNWILTPVIIFLLFVGAMQYKECFYQEYYSTYVPQTEEFFAENLKENDYILYNWEDFGFIYECYFPEKQLKYSETFDFSRDFDTAWFLDSEWMPDIGQEVLDENGLIMEYVGHYGVEHNEFDIYKIYKK